VTDPQFTAAIDAAFAPARSPDAFAVFLDGEAVILDERLDRLHLLNHTATLLWQLFDGAVTLTELASELGDELHLDAGVVLEDLVTITRHLGEEGLLEGVARRDDPADG
jgi:hypothetical protein